MIDGENVTTCLCPVLGKTYAHTYYGMCPDHLQKPYGKELKISFIGVRPYINPYNRLIEGSDFLVAKLLAEKFKFRPEFLPEKAFDVVKRNGQLYGMLHRVRVRNVLQFP